jgi:NAD(P)-dependent dehydrogenase (short-subunit alcohol dehydrogenase family)
MLTNKKILITGASSGIGRQIAIDCAINNASIFICARRKSELNNVLSLFNSSNENFAFQVDLTKEMDLDQMISNLPILDGIVLNAGLISYRPISLINYKSIKDVFSINFDANVILIQKLLKLKKINNNASIVFISSISSHFGINGTALYAASKAALNSFSKVLASELSDKGIRSNTISPGLIGEDNLCNQSYPLGLGKVADVSNQAIYLLSNNSRWITGSDFLLDGGYSLK